jgi:hypothetical protein
VTDYTPTSWAAALLARLGLPTTSANVTAITAWETAEGGNWHNSDRYNPLNTTQSAPGAVATNSAGVKAYQSWDQGLTATVQTLTNGMYGGILTALGRGDSADAVVSAVVKSPWGTKNISLNGVSASAPAGTDAVQAGLGSDLSGTFNALTKVTLTVAFVVGGALLVVLGLVRGTDSHPIAKLQERGEKVATTAAMVA